MKNVSITIPNLEKFRKALRAYPHIVAPKIQQALTISIDEIHRNTTPLTPIDTGDLRLSLGENKEIRPLSGVIGSDLDYAVVQHENTSFRHPGGGGAKYLERGVQSTKKTIEKVFKTKINEAFDEIARRSN